MTEIVKTFKHSNVHKKTHVTKPHTQSPSAGDSLHIVSIRRCEHQKLSLWEIVVKLMRVMRQPTVYTCTNDNIRQKRERRNRQKVFFHTCRRSFIEAALSFRRQDRVEERVTLHRSRHCIERCLCIDTKFSDNPFSHFRGNKILAKLRKCSLLLQF